MRTLLRAALVAAASLLLVLGLVGGTVAQEKFKLGMMVGGNTCCEWMKAQGDVARALAEKMGWDYVELSNNNDPRHCAQERADHGAGRRRRRDPVQRPAVDQPGDQPDHGGRRHPDRDL